MVMVVGCKSEELSSDDLEAINEYIRDTRVEVFSFLKMLEKAECEIDHLNVEDLNVLVNEEGYIDSFNLIYSIEKDQNIYTMRYRRDEKSFRILTKPFSASYSMRPTDSHRIFWLIDEGLIRTSLKDCQYDAYVIDLLSPVEIRHDVLKGQVVFNGEPIADNILAEVEGITFFVYSFPVKQDDNGTFYVYE